MLSLLKIPKRLRNLYISDKILPLPPPYQRMVAINSDVEWTSWQSQINLINLFEQYNLETAFSYWFYGSPKVTWRLFENHYNDKSQHFHHALKLIKNGFLDTIHSFGGRKHLGGCDFNRSSIEQAYKLLADNGASCSIYSNHGSTLDRQNIAGEWGTYHEGDVPSSDLYHMDLTRQFGIKYFWCDPDYEISEAFLEPTIGEQNSLFVQGHARDGSSFLRFKRFFGENIPFGPSLDNFHQQLEQIIASKKKGYSILYQHLGVWRKEDGKPEEANTESIPKHIDLALKKLRHEQNQGNILITTTQKLLNHAVLMAARPWNVQETKEKFIVIFDKFFNFGNTYFQIDQNFLSGWTIRSGKKTVECYLGNHKLELDRFLYDDKVYYGFKWSIKDTKHYLILPRN